MSSSVVTAPLEAAITSFLQDIANWAYRHDMNKEVMVHLFKQSQMLIQAVFFTSHFQTANLVDNESVVVIEPVRALSG
jgi:hypothetical protein